MITVSTKYSPALHAPVNVLARISATGRPKPTVAERRLAAKRVFDMPIFDLAKARELLGHKSADIRQATRTLGAKFICYKNNDSSTADHPFDLPQQELT